jgi:predicted lactoylglutathione lyase
MNDLDQCPMIGVAHVVLHTNKMRESAQFMLTIGARPVFQGDEVSVFELRGGTHLILMQKTHVVLDDAPFDLMVDDIHATHRLFTTLGLNPSPIESRPAIDHEVFSVREPAGHLITFFSSHVSGKPV